MFFRVRKDGTRQPVVEIHLRETVDGVEILGTRPGDGEVLIGRFCNLGFVRSNGLGASCIPVDESGCIKVV